MPDGRVKAAQSMGCRKIKPARERWLGLAAARAQELQLTRRFLAAHNQPISMSQQARSRRCTSHAGQSRLLLVNRGGRHGRQHLSC